LIGTVNYILPGVVEEASRTTPESVDLQEMLWRIREGGFKAAALEASSHAIVQERLRSIEWDVAIFTNLTQDHLDFHGSMEEYFNAKARLFTTLPEQRYKRGKAVINVDDRYGRLLLERLPSQLPVITYGQSSSANFRASNICCSATGTEFCLEARGRSYLVRSPLIGLFNLYNALAALASANAMGLELRRAVQALESAPQVPGRLERLPGKQPFQVYVDYAHTPDALENVLRALDQLKKGRLLVVFGCGGDRDRSKRPLMAAAAERYGDEVIVTTDNPRSEDPLTIIAEIEKGFQGSRYRSIADREKAIHEAVRHALPGDMVLIAGKGHEHYQEVDGLRSPFDDIKVAQRAVRARNEY
jgi:UDP-N-acetylmuramoyl-L-alanyl-D-glutamate--2,6-diaminopimelate ligase